MPYYVVLNFEDPNPKSATGVLTGSKSSKPGVTGAADGTLQVYHKRAAQKSTFFNGKKVAYYSCQELLARDANKSLSKGDVIKIRRDCESAKTVAILLHGKPSDTNHGFSTGGASICTWGQLAQLSLLLFPDSGTQFNIALIMCYGARSDDASLDHRGQIPPDALKSSFAYKFFKAICRLRNVRMTARTGAVSSDADVNHTVETEEQVFAVVEKQAAMGKRALNKPAMDLQKTQLLNGQITAQQFDQLLFKFAEDPKRVPANAIESFAKDYVIYSPYVTQFIQNQYDAGSLGNRSKYGKLIYNFDGVLSIVARYDSGAGANYELYRGPLL